jgi:hypothetical protein
MALRLAQFGSIAVAGRAIRLRAGSVRFCAGAPAAIRTVVPANLRTYGGSPSNNRIWTPPTTD